MLLRRSMLLKVIFVFTISACNCQYEEYGVEDHADISDGSDGEHVDYSKYYLGGDTSAPLVSAGGGGEEFGFTGFFGPEFGASVQNPVKQLNNPFNENEKPKASGFVEPINFNLFAAASFAHPSKPTDYFEASQRQQQYKEKQQQEASSYDIPPGPSYVSHHVPAKLAHASSESQESLPVNDGKYNDYSIGKASSTVSQSKFAPSGKRINPYKEYSFQQTPEAQATAKYLSSLISTVAPFNPSYSKVVSTATPSLEASESRPEHLKNKNCVKTQKYTEGENRGTPISCYVCEDPETNGKLTHCSYANEDEPVNISEGASETYSIPRQPDSYRYKRYSGDEERSSDRDPYEYVKSRSLALTGKNSPVEEESRSYGSYHPEDYYDGYSYSESQSEQIKKNPENCKKSVKDGVTCTVCRDPATGGNFEQCSYTTSPKAEKYAYVTDTKYNSEDEAEESKKKEVQKDAPKSKDYTPSDSEQSEVTKGAPTENPYKPPVNDNYRSIEDFDVKPSTQKENYDDKPEKNTEDVDDEYGRPVDGKPRKFINDEPYDVPAHFAESTQSEEQQAAPSYNYGESEDDEDEELALYKEIEDYHKKLFPQESKQTEVQENPESRKDVEEVLAEFSKKDRSKCKKAEKKGMTCYLCVDDKGIQNEECMYVSESKPKATHLAYHEVKQIKKPEKPTSEAAAESKTFPVSASSTKAPALEAAASSTQETKVKYNKPKKYIKRSNKKRSPKKSDKDVTQRLQVEENEPTQETPVEFDVGEKEGAFSAETKPVYSKALGVKLPRYMVEKSDFEKEFDDDAHY